MIVSSKSRVVLVAMALVAFVAIGVGVGIASRRVSPMIGSAYWESGWLDLGDGVAMKIRVATTPTPMPTATEIPMPTATMTPTPTVVVEPSATATMTPVPTATGGPMGGECTIVLNPGSVQYDGGGVSPGAVICLEAGNYTKIAFRDLQGTAEKPITIRNDGGQVRGWDPNQEFYLCRDCSHIRLTGTGAPGAEYGFYFRSPVKIYGHSHHIEVDHIEMDGARLSVKDTLDPDFEMTDIRIHHCYMHDSPNAFYLGVSGYHEHPGEFISRRVEVDHNLFENNGGRALKVTGIVEDCIIHDNVIRDAVTDGANAALAISEGTKAEVYNNVIVGSGGCGILMNNSPFSARIYNNLLVETGGGSGGYVDAILAWSDNNMVYNNTIIGAGRYGVAFRCSECRGNEAFNNIIIGTAGDSIAQGGSPDANFYHNLTKEAGYTVENLRFVEPARGDYHLVEDSPAIDAGGDGYPPYDLDGVGRPQGTAADVGAYER